MVGLGLVDVAGERVGIWLFFYKLGVLYKGLRAPSKRLGVDIRQV